MHCAVNHKGRFCQSITKGDVAIRVKGEIIKAGQTKEYEVQDGDTGRTIRVRVTARHDRGQSSAIPNPTPVVGGAPQRPARAQQVEGCHQPGGAAHRLVGAQRAAIAEQLESARRVSERARFHALLVPRRGHARAAGQEHPHARPAAHQTRGNPRARAALPPGA